MHDNDFRDGSAVDRRNFWETASGVGSAARHTRALTGQEGRDAACRPTQTDRWKMMFGSEVRLGG
ncbi:hypothetical protein EBBID32_19710 [Sphingobium indicum BiD32]|uniref:Uncharacterized protein n=1 Tax=Sphingobium indicum BiD32 TaxID=1301087 RepID=N1MK85_9SPHN|nr:hypothetical protein EBBID32_19710 [Sphingobium indicum BiD32]